MRVCGEGSGGGQLRPQGILVKERFLSPEHTLSLCPLSLTCQRVCPTAPAGPWRRGFGGFTSWPEPLAQTLGPPGRGELSPWPSIMQSMGEGLGRDGAGWICQSFCQPYLSNAHCAELCFRLGMGTEWSVNYAEEALCVQEAPNQFQVPDSLFAGGTVEQGVPPTHTLGSPA